MSIQSASAVCMALFGVSRTKDIRLQGHLRDAAKKLGLSIRGKDKNWLVLDVARAGVEKGWASIREGTDMNKVKVDDVVVVHDFVL